MTETTRKDFGQCLAEALAAIAKWEAAMQEFAEQPDTRLQRFAELFKPVEVEKLRRCITTPEGRAFLRGGIHTPAGRQWLGLGESGQAEGIDIREGDILRWAFTAELMQLGPDLMPAQEALSLVNQGITLRDIKAKPALKARIRELGDDLVCIQYYDLLSVSDFHLAGGNHPAPGGLARFSPTEDFYFDDAFFRFLHHGERERRARDGYPYELVLNGDTIDFVQVVIRSISERQRGDWDFVLPDSLQPPGWEEETGPTTLGSLGPGATAKSARKEKEELQAILGAVWTSHTNKKATRPAASLVTAATGEGDKPGLDQLMPGVQVQIEPAQPKRQVRKRREEAESRREQGQRKVMAMGRVEALDQLAEVCRGHPRFFQGLAWFLAQGNRLVLIRGNHDAQWYWPEVQIAFCGWLKQAYDELRRACDDPTTCYEMAVPKGELGSLPDMTQKELAARVDFDHGWFYTRDRLAYFEHGGQQEAVDAHRYFLQPVYPRAEPGDKQAQADPPARAADWLPDLKVGSEEQEIDPPLGSLGNVFLVNNLEIELPNFERPGYDKVYLPWLQYHGLGLLFGALFRAVGRLLKAWIEWARRWPDLAESHTKRVQAYGQLTGLPDGCARELDETYWVRQWRKPVAGRILAAVIGVLQAAVVVVPLAAIGIALWILLSGVLEEPVWEAMGSVPKSIVAFVGGGVAYWLLKWVRTWIGLDEDYLFEPSRRVARILTRHGRDVPYILFGHDHAHNTQPLDVGRQCRQPGCTGQLSRGDFQAGELVAPKVRCLKCHATVSTRKLRRPFSQAWVEQGRSEPDEYTITCPHCGEETPIDSDTDLEWEEIRCKKCDRELSKRDIESSPQRWAAVESFGVTLACPRCGEPLPGDQMQVIPHSVILTCPQCGRAERQWLPTWHLDCPGCGKKPSRRHLRLTEEWPYIDCPCNTHYPPPPPVKRWYLNTGTWTPMYAKDRRRVVREAHEYAFVRMIDTQRVLASDDALPEGKSKPQPRVELLRWNDAARRVEPCETFQGTDELN